MPGNKSTLPTSGAHRAMITDTAACLGGEWMEGRLLQRGTEKRRETHTSIYQTLRILGKHISAVLAFGKLVLSFNFLIKRNYIF